jgi:hypothetical protein
MMPSSESVDFSAAPSNSRRAEVAVFALVGRSDDELAMRQAELERLLTAQPTTVGAVAARTELAMIAGLLADRRRCQTDRLSRD